MNLTATNASTRSYLTAAPTGAAFTTSTVNYEPGKDISNQAVVPVSNGSITVHNNGGSVDAVQDVVGYYSIHGQGVFTPVPPSRVLDTPAGGHPLGPDSTLRLAVTGRGGVPAGAIGAVVNLTATQETRPSHLTVGPTSSPGRAPPASTPTRGATSPATSRPGWGPTARSTSTTTQTAPS
ncbi:hypothetical protein [Streptacidiphilus sp. EB129]|uniref:hypothetical protein n=1 Tax=Streptacidiphilus sp. EB129 TaxID=3156262 RepID=UPI003513E4A8